jgi:DNA-binding transcriptional LysR family regulator
MGDELLVRGPDGLVPTARAATLAGPLRALMADLERTLASPAPFDARTAERAFRVAAADYGQFVLLPRLLSLLAAEAPRIDVWAISVPAEESAASLLARGELDLLVGASTAAATPAGLYERTLFEEEFVCVVRADHPVVRDRLDLETFCALPHAFIAPRGSRGGAVDTALAAIGRSRRIALAVPHFLVIPHVIAHTDLVVTLAARVAHAFAERLPLRILPPPLPLPPFKMVLRWHERHHRDPGHAWLREVFARAAQD